MWLTQNTNIFSLYTIFKQLELYTKWVPCPFSNLPIQHRKEIKFKARLNWILLNDDICCLYSSFVSVKQLVGEITDNYCWLLLTSYDFLSLQLARCVYRQSTVWRLFPRQTIKAGVEDLYGYGHTKIGMVGTTTFSVCYGSRALPAFTFQVSRHGSNLLGFDLFCALGFSITDNTGANILTVNIPWPHRWL